MDNFSNLMMIGECLLDKKRTLIFKKAIKETVKEGDIVLDAGTGSGIMAMFAAKCGAKKVYGIEIDPEIASIAKSNVKHNKLDHIVEIINEDMKKITFPKIDVLIMEMMDTGLIAEQQVVACNNLISKEIIDADTKMIPFYVETYIEFMDYDFNFYDTGIKTPMIIQARNCGVKKHIKKITPPKVLIQQIKLNKVNNLKFNSEFSFVAQENLYTNSFLMTMKTFLTPNITCWETSDMNMPVVFPIKPIKLEKDKKYKFKISYELSKGYHTVDFMWII